MTETVGIRQDVTNPDYHSRTQYRSRFLLSAAGILTITRRTVDKQATQR